jgi:transcriptional repressor NrdR
VKCPFCTHPDSKVTDSRTSAALDVTRRRRECEHCGRRFTTYERVEETLPSIVKKDGRREPFERQKILIGLRKACEKRPIPMAALELAVDDIERELIEAADKEVPGSVIGQAVMRRLRALDGIAYVRFASVYREFRDLDELRYELDRIANEPVSVRGSALLALANAETAAAGEAAVALATNVNTPTANVDTAARRSGTPAALFESGVVPSASPNAAAEAVAAAEAAEPAVRAERGAR